MNKIYPWFILSLLLTGAIWFFTPASNPDWIKNSIFIGLIIYLLLLFLFFSKFPTPDSNKQYYFGLTEKLYTGTLMAAMGIYCKGIWFITPDTNPIWLKHLFLGIGLLILFVFFLYFIFKKVDEKPDDRFYTNLARAASFTLITVLISLLILSMVTFMVPFTLNAGMLLIYSAGMILIFDFSFFFFEKRGG